MDLAALPSSLPGPFRRGLLPRLPPPSPAAAKLCHVQPRRWRRRKGAALRTLAYVATAEDSPLTAEASADLERRKHDLLRAVQDTQRGLVTTGDQRSAIEEALVCVEGYGAGSTVDLDKLDGTWRLVYTSASDVLILFEAATRLPFLQILQFFRTFRAQLPLRSPERRSPGGLYYLSYLDRDMLLGRAVGGGGIFVFTRAQALT